MAKMAQFTLYPAIDLKDGQCVRLYQGSMQQATIYAQNPAEQAQKFIDEGAQYLHLVDLNGAFVGHSVNEFAIDSILRVAGGVPIQLGGGIRSLAAVDYWLERGIERVILGTAALKNPQLLVLAAEKYPKRIMLGIDSLNGMVAVEGWAEASAVSALELAQRFDGCDLGGIIHTDIVKDGTMAGSSVALSAAIATQISNQVIVSGGIGALNHLVQLKEYPKIAGVIVGRALYEKKFTLKQAIELFY